MGNFGKIISLETQINKNLVILKKNWQTRN